MREGARERGSGREEQTAERESVGGKMLTLLLHLGERQIEGNKGGKKEGKDQGNMGEGEGRSRSEGACVKVAVREGASLIPRASYQTVSRLQQLLSAQNTQALPFQLKGSLTKSEGEKKYPAGGELGSLQHKGLFGGSSIARAPREPQPQVPPQQWLWRRPWVQAVPDPALGLWLALGCSRWVQLSLPAQFMGLRAQRAGPRGKGALGRSGCPSGRAVPQQAAFGRECPWSCSPGQQ